MFRPFWTTVVPFLLAATPLCVAFSALNRYPDVIAAKLAYYREHHEQFDTIVVGSSMAFCGIDPRVLDETLRDEGIPSSTFNLSIDGLHGHEIDEVLRLALKADRNRSIKRVIVDMRPTTAEGNPFDDNPDVDIWWHSPQQTWSVLSTLWKSSLPTEKKLRLSAWHISLLLRNHIPVGVALAQYRKWAGRSGKDWFTGAYPDLRGFQPLSVDDVAERILAGHPHANWIKMERHDSMMMRRKELEGRLPALAREADKFADLKNENVEFWRNQAQRLRERNILALYVLMPGHINPFMSRANTLARDRVIHHYISYCDPDRFPELFPLEIYFNDGHLNREGARILSRLLALEVASLIRASAASELEPVEAREKTSPDEHAGLLIPARPPLSQTP